MHADQESRFGKLLHVAHGGLSHGNSCAQGVLDRVPGSRPLRLLDGDYPERGPMMAIADYNLGQAPAQQHNS